MNMPSRLSDSQINDLLRRRSMRPAPDGLASAVLESLASERARHPVRTTGRSSKRPLVLLAAAALLLAGGALVAGSGVLRRPAVVPPVPAPSLAAVVPASPEPPSPSPSDLTRPSSSPTPTPAAMPTPYPPTAGPVPKGARPWSVTVVNRSSKPAPLFLVSLDSNGNATGELCGSATPDVVPAGVTEKVVFQLPPRSVDCQLGVRPLGGLAGSNWYTSDVPQPGHLLIADGGDNANGDDLSTVWVGP